MHDRSTREIILRIQNIGCHLCFSYSTWRWVEVHTASCLGNALLNLQFWLFLINFLFHWIYKRFTNEKPWHIQLHSLTLYSLCYVHVHNYCNTVHYVRVVLILCTELLAELPATSVVSSAAVRICQSTRVAHSTLGMVHEFTVCTVWYSILHAH